MVTYRLACASFLALRIQPIYYIIDEGLQFPLAVPVFKKGRYVDDIFGGTNSLQQTLKVIR